MAISNIGKGAILSYIAIFLNIIISFVYTPWMLKQIGTSDYGLYSLILSFISYFMIDFGLNAATSRFVTVYRAAGNDKMVENVQGLMLKIFFTISIAIFIILLVCYFFLADIFKGLTPEEIDRLKVLYVIAGTFSTLSFSLKPLEGALNAYELFVPAKLIDMFYKVGSVLFVVIALSLGGDIYSLILINGLIGFGCSVVRFFYWRKCTGLTPDLKYNDYKEMKAIVSFSGWTFLIGMAQRFRLTLVPSVLGIFSNSEQIAVFALGMTMEAMTWTLSSALNGLFLPKVARLVHDNNRDAIMQLMVRVGRIQLFIVTIIFSVFFVVGQEFVHLWVGDEFMDVYWIVLFLICTNLISNTLAVANDMIISENKIQYTAPNVFICSLLGIGCSCLVASGFGAIGCAACSGVALMLTQILNIRVYQRKLNLDMYSFFNKVHVRILPLLTVCAGLFYFLFHYLNINNWLGLFLIAGVYVLAFLGVSYFVLFNGYEKSLVKSLICRK